MDIIDFDRLADDCLAKAREAKSQRFAHTLYAGAHGHHLGQVLLALTQGADMRDHVNPGEATIQVLRGRITLGWDDGSVEIDAGRWAVIPPVTHHVRAEEDSVILLTVSRP